MGTQWIEDLIEFKEGKEPFAKHDFDKEHKIPKFLKDYYYFYSQGSSKSEVRRYFVLPDLFPLYRYRYSQKQKKLCKRPIKTTIKKLKELATDDGELGSIKTNGGHENVYWSKRRDLSNRVHVINDVYLGPGPCKESDTFDYFVVTHACCGYEPDSVQIRKDGKIFSTKDLCTKENSYFGPK